jgi:DNA-binding LacI/PurR family transcriptional regulator
MDKRATINDIAQRSGYSAATVSLVLNHRAGVTNQTRDRVEKAAEALGYDLTRLKRKRQTANKSVTTFGLLLRLTEQQFSQTNPFYSVVVMGIEEACRQQNIQLLYNHVHVDLRNRPCEIPKMISNRRLDGLMLVGTFLEEPLLQALIDTKMPVVLVDAYSSRPIFDSIVTPNFSGAYEAVHHLIQRGHRRIAMVGASPGIYPSFDERRQGYLSALRDNYIDDGRFMDCVVHVSGEGFYETAHQLLHDHPETTAVVCANDSMAIEVIRAAQALNIRVPHDLSVIGFDDIDAASYITPALTTVQVDKVNMGRLAVRTLQQRIQFPEFPPITHSLPVKLVERGSVLDQSLEGKEVSGGKDNHFSFVK